MLLSKKAFLRSPHPDEREALPTMEASTVVGASKIQADSQPSPRTSISETSAIAHAPSGLEPSVEKTSLALSPKANPAFDPQTQEELNSWAVSKAGFRPPDFPDYDRLFIERSQRYHRSYSGAPFSDGIYFGIFKSEVTGVEPLYFWIHLKNADTANTHVLQASWLTWNSSFLPNSFGGLESMSSDFQSDSFYKVIHLPTKIFQNRIREAAGCAEITVLPSYDSAEGSHLIRYFNARGYCRRNDGNLKSMGSFAFKRADSK